MHVNATEGPPPSAARTGAVRIGGSGPHPGCLYCNGGASRPSCPRSSASSGSQTQSPLAESRLPPGHGQEPQEALRV